MRLLTALVLLGLALHVAGDSYLHGPRGSNNRLNEQAANRNNADRLFDSQNNNRGGYNVGDKSTTAFDANDPDFDSPDQNFDPNNQDDKQYSLAYYEGSVVLVEWTNQHGCGGNEEDDPYILNCNIVLQYMCDIDHNDPTHALDVNLKDGGNTNTPNEPNTFADTNPANDQDDNEGHHESSGWYYECKMTMRNMRLFHADQDLNGDDARYTRQNPNGDRRGLECPEERDYYPYWRPTPWRDIAYLTDIVQDENEELDDMTFCEWIQSESQNVNNKYKCIGPVENNQQAPITADECDNVGGSWEPFQHEGTEEPICEMVAWSRANHLGNGRFNQPLTFNWTIPDWDDLDAELTSFGATYEAKKCILRLRYNISTDDYDPWKTNSTWDDDPDNGIASPVTENPTVDIGANLIGLKLAINTAQFGRTFQDRTHIFYIVKLPDSGPLSDPDGTIYNLNVRGKRGNIVQTYPAVEYDFQPNRLHIDSDDWIHIQWTGSNTHNNGNPAGDGQAGDAGEGTGGTDRHNFVELLDISKNWPLTLDVNDDKNIFADMQRDTCYMLDGTPLGNDWVDCAVTLATSGLFTSDDETDYANFNPTLDNAPPSLAGGVLMQPGDGTYHYMCTRNNNFSNRSQKGTLIVGEDD